MMSVSSVASRCARRALRTALVSASAFLAGGSGGGNLCFSVFLPNSAFLIAASSASCSSSFFWTDTSLPDCSASFALCSCAYFFQPQS